MSRITAYRTQLQHLSDWEPFLASHSGLPGPRGNLELAHAVAQEGTEQQFHRWTSLTAEQAPENTPQVFLAFCGVLGFGAVMARQATDPRASAGGAEASLRLLRGLASDTRWRIREAVATALQLWGDVDFAGLLAEMTDWAAGGYYEQRAAAAALCEPRLLSKRERGVAVLTLLDYITTSVAAAPTIDRKTDAFRTLRQALGYCWSVAVAAEPETGVPTLVKWIGNGDFDVRWIMRENLRKKRIAALDIQLPE